MYMDFYPVTRRRRRRRRTLAELVRHARNYCRICSHARWAEIEQDFLNWRDPREILREYGLVHHSVIYRHANALGLMAPRNANARAQLDVAEEGRWDGPAGSGAAGDIQRCRLEAGGT